MRQPSSHPACSPRATNPLAWPVGFPQPILPSEVFFKLNFGRSPLPACLLSFWGFPSFSAVLASGDNVCITQTGLGWMRSLGGRSVPPGHLVTACFHSGCT